MYEFVGLQTLPGYEDIQVATIAMVAVVVVTLVVVVTVYMTWEAMGEDRHRPNLEDTDTPYDHSTAGEHGGESDTEHEGDADANADAETAPA